METRYSILLLEKQRFGELSRLLAISPRILSRELHELELHQLVTRTVTVEYAATAHAHTLQDVIQAMHQWPWLKVWFKS